MKFNLSSFIHIYHLVTSMSLILIRTRIRTLPSYFFIIFSTIHKKKSNLTVRSCEIG